ncbi:MAG: hypothetical protein Q8O67_19730 [Deltaproteobacteria bacterium]|nr:hypothetical protein [Deltaproteobacteria bacterium]
MTRVSCGLLCASLLVASSALVGCPDDDFRVPPPPEPVVSTVTVTKAGNGKGVLRSLPAGVICDVDCETATFSYEDTDSLDVVAAPSREANFGGLECSAGEEELRVEQIGGTDDATLTLPTIVDGVGKDWSCSGTFVLVHTLQVVADTAGTGSGRVRGTLTTGVEPRIDCASDQTCVAAYFDGDEETLIATPDVGSVFSRWEFCASNATTPTITLVMLEDEDCRPVFDLQ